jgi:D-glycero-D-manno-heptose 1,7-bisphosphate phosphatase
MTRSSLNPPAVFLDRDGTLMEEVHYCCDPEKVRILPGVVEGLESLRSAGFALVLITNQSGIGRGLFSEAQYRAVHARLLELLPAGILGGTYYCPDIPEQPSLRRKPAPGMIFEAAAELGLDLARSWMVGDKDVDCGCGRNAGVRTVLVRTGHGAKSSGVEADWVAKDFASAVAHILNEAGDC